MSVAALPHAKLMHAIELLGTRVAPLVRTALASKTAGAPLLTNSQYKGNGSTTNLVGEEIKSRRELKHDKDRNHSRKHAPRSKWRSGREVGLRRSERPPRRGSSTR